MIDVRRRGPAHHLALWYIISHKAYVFPASKPNICRTKKDTCILTKKKNHTMSTSNFNRNRVVDRIYFIEDKNKFDFKVFHSMIHSIFSSLQTQHLYHKKRHLYLDIKKKNHTMSTSNFNRVVDRIYFIEDKINLILRCSIVLLHSILSQNNNNNNNI